MLKPGRNLAALCSATLLALSLYGCGDTTPDIDYEPTYDDSPLQFGISFSGSKLEFDWDAVDSATQYRLTQTAGATTVIPDPGLVLTSLSTSIDTTTLTYDAESTAFLLEAFVGTEWTTIGVQNGFGSFITNVELQFAWEEVAGVTQYCIEQIAGQLDGEAPIIEGELIVSGLETIVDATDKIFNTGTLAFSLQTYDAVDGCQIIETDNNFAWDAAFFDSPLRLEFPFTPRTIAFGWNKVDAATQYRLTQTHGRWKILPGDQKLYTADEFIDRFQVPVHLFDWEGSKFTLEALVEGEWQLAGQQDTAGGSTLAIETFTEADVYASSFEFQSQLVFGFNVALTEDGTTMAVGAIGETSIPVEQSELDLTLQGPPYIGRQLQFSWNEVEGATEYRLIQLAGDAIVIEDELVVTALQGVINIFDEEFDSSTLVFSLEANVTDLGWQEIPLGDEFEWRYVPSVAVRNAGAVFVYDLETRESVKVKSPLIDAEDQFGRSVAISDDGQILAVAASSEDNDAAGIQTALDPALDNNNAYQSGAVYVYLRNGSEWDLEAYIKAPIVDPAVLDENGDPEEFGDFFGWALSMSSDGNTLAISSISEDGDGTGPENNSLSDSGAVFIYRRVAGVWTQEAYLKASNAGAQDSFGNALAMSAAGDYLAVAALGESGASGDPASNARSRSGAVYVFARDPGTGAWVETSYLKASNADAGDFFGQSISFDAAATMLAVGAPGEDQLVAGVATVNSGDGSGGGSLGAAYLFERTGSGLTSSWDQKSFYFKASNPFPSARFGQSVVLSSGGDYLVVGAWNDANPTAGVNGGQNSFGMLGSGAAYLFERQFDDNDAWKQIAFIKAPVQTQFLHFGSAIDMALNGELLGVAGTGLGSRGEITGRPGNVYIY